MSSASTLLRLNPLPTSEERNEPNNRHVVLRPCVCRTHEYQSGLLVCHEYIGMVPAASRSIESIKRSSLGGCVLLARSAIAPECLSGLLNNRSVQ